MGQQSKARINPGTLVVLEGLDATGKSTQMQVFAEARQRGMFDHDLVLTHQPSGGSAVGNAVYVVTENAEIHSAWARQFLHLASHAEHYKTEIAPALEAGTPVIMDRCWWSTIAYGWFSGKLSQDGALDYPMFERMVQVPTLGWMPDAVFLFMDPWEDDHHNTPELIEGYEFLAEHSGCPVARIEKGDRSQTFMQILMKLAELDLAS